MEVYYDGPLSDYCCPLLAAIKDAISSCADLLSYEPSALDCEAIVPCNQQHSTKSCFHPIQLCNDVTEGYIANCSIEPHLSFKVTDERQTCWLSGKVHY